MTKEQILAKFKADLEARGFSNATISAYTSRLKHFQDHFGKPADEMGEAEIVEHQRHLLTEKGLAPASANCYNSALRFAYGVTLGRGMNYKSIPRVKQTRRIPQLFSREEIARIIDSAKTLEKRAMFMLAYGSGLRLSEITNLKVSDIESSHMRILVQHGKGNRDRYALLPQSTLETLREHWLACRPVDWLFVAPKKGGKYSRKTLGEAFRSALKRSGVTTPGSIHMFRHCFATHLYEDGASLLAMKKLLGHVRIDTTAWYTQIADTQMRGMESPIETLPLKKGNPRKVNPDA